MNNLIDKNIIEENIRKLVESDFFYQIYNKLVDENDSLSQKEEISAQVFNTILFVCQLVSDLEICKQIIIELLKHGMYDFGGILSCSYPAEFEYLNIISKYDTDYLIDGKNKMYDRLKHGFAVHFTTPKIIDKIKNTKYLYAHESMFSKAIERKIQEASNYQLEHHSQVAKYGNYLSQGFGFSKGISMGAQTVGYWMNHTPESLSFLFGGLVYTRDKKGAMEYVESSIDSLPIDRQQEMLKILEYIWDELVGEDRRLGCILIDRDSLEYETVTYWNEEPKRVEEVRPYQRHNLEYFSITEESRYDKDIPVSGLRFMSVPSIYQLEEYCKLNPIAEDDKLREPLLSFEDFDSTFFKL